MGLYAKETSVNAERSQAEIQRILQRYGATGFASGWQGMKAMVMFQMNKRQVRFNLPLVTPESSEVTHGARGQAIPKRYLRDRADQMNRQRWRALALAIKAKLEAVESGITIFDEEFLAHIVLPSGQTFGDVAVPQIETTYESGKMPPLLGVGQGD